MTDSDMKDCDIMDSFDPKFEKFRSKDCNDFKVSSRMFKSFDTKVSEVNEPDTGILKDSSGNFQSFESKVSEEPEVSDRKFENSDSKISNDSLANTDSEDSSRNFESFGSKQSTKHSKVDQRSKPRTLKQQEAYKKNFSKGKSIERKIQDLDSRVRQLQSILIFLGSNP